MYWEFPLAKDSQECQSFHTQVQFCGRMIDANGVTFHRRHYEALTSMEAPTTVGALMELVHGANCMRTAIPRFSELIEPLHNLLEAQYSIHNSRKKSRVCNRPLSAWGMSTRLLSHPSFRRSPSK